MSPINTHEFGTPGNGCLTVWRLNEQTKKDQSNVSARATGPHKDEDKVMTPDSPARMVVVKKEEKEPRLRQLVLAGLLAQLQAGQGQAGQGQVCQGQSDRGMNPGSLILRLVAQSLASPVARALAALQGELAAAGVSARVILTRADPPPFMIGRACALRQLSDVRCHDAHELLVLGSQTTWIGDCMRRDPAVRDSFELHAPGCVETARLVTLSFDKLWQLSAACEPMDDRATLLMAADLAGLPGDHASQVTALTRH